MDEKICSIENPFYSLSVKVYFDPQLIFLKVSYLPCKLESSDMFNQKKKIKAENYPNLSSRIFLCCSLYFSYALQQGPSRSGLWC